MGGGGVWLSKKWLAPLFRGFHSSLAPTARPGSYAEKPLLRKAFCGFDAHVAKSDYSLRGAKPSAASGGRSEAEAQRARERQEGPTGRRSATFANCIAAPEPPGVFRQVVSGSRRQSLRLPLFRARSAPPPPRRAPNGNLLPRAGVHPSAIRRLPWGRRKAGADMRGAAAFWGRGLWPRPQNMPAAGQSPAAGGWAAPTRRRPPPALGFSPTAKKAAKKPGPTIYGAGHTKRWQEGARQRPNPSGKARAHGLRARAASFAPPRATILRQPRPLVREYRRPRRTAVGVAQGG